MCWQCGKNTFLPSKIFLPHCQPPPPPITLTHRFKPLHPSTPFILPLQLGPLASPPPTPQLPPPPSPFHLGPAIQLGILGSVADPGCLSRILDPDFYPFRIPDPGFRIPDPKTAAKERVKKFVVKPFFVATNFIKLNIIIYYIF